MAGVMIKGPCVILKGGPASRRVYYLADLEIHGREDPRGVAYGYEPNGDVVSLGEVWPREADVNLAGTRCGVWVWRGRPA